MYQTPGRRRALPQEAAARHTPPKPEPPVDGPVPPSPIPKSAAGCGIHRIPVPSLSLRLTSTITFGMYWKECPPFRSLLAIAVPFLRNLCPGAAICRMRSDPTRKKREKYDSRRISIICELSRYSGHSRSGWSIFLLGVKSYPLPLSHMESRVFYHPMFKRLRLNTDLRLL